MLQGDIKLLRYHKMPKIWTPPLPLFYTCSLLVAPSPFELLTFTTPHKNIKFYDFKVVIMSHCKYHKNFPRTFPEFAKVCEFRF